jgi:hypothetical protein
MKPEDLARFTAEARRLFRGDWEEEIWSVSISRIRTLRPSLAMAALHEYATAHGGARARFIPGKFLEFVAVLTKATADEKADAARRTEVELRSLHDRDERARVRAEWDACRHAIRSAGDATRANAIDRLLRAGWPKPPADLDAWPRSWVLAVSDIVTHRTPPEFYESLGRTFPH